MTSKERQAYAERLMQVLKGQEPAAMLTETGELNAAPTDVMEPDIPEALRAMFRLTSADRRDRTAIRTLRAQVLAEAPTCGYAPMQEHPIGCLALLCAREMQAPASERLWKQIPTPVRQWMRDFQYIQLRAMGRWLNRVPRILEVPAVKACDLWILKVWFEETPLPGMDWPSELS